MSNRMNKTFVPQTKLHRFEDEFVKSIESW